MELETRRQSVRKIPCPAGRGRWTYPWSTGFFEMGVFERRRDNQSLQGGGYRNPSRVSGKRNLQQTYPCLGRRDDKRRGRLNLQHPQYQKHSRLSEDGLGILGQATPQTQFSPVGFREA